MAKKNSGFAKVPRELLYWDWYTDMPVRTIYMHCLLRANFQDNEWRGIKIKRNQFITSYKNLAFETGLTRKQVIRAISVLTRAQLIRYQGHNNGKAGYSIITVFELCEKNSEGTVKDTVTQNPKVIPRDTDKNDIKNDIRMKKEELPPEDEYDDEEDEYIIPYQDENGEWIVGGA